MSAIDDLNAAISTLSDSISAEIKALTTALSFVGQDAAIEASVKKITDLNAALKASIPQPAPASRFHRLSQAHFLFF